MSIGRFFSSIMPALTWVLKIWTSPRRGCAMTMLAAALPTNQSPAMTSIGAPFSEYGCTLVSIMGKRENMTRPAPNAPLRTRLTGVRRVFGGRHTCRRTSSMVKSRLHSRGLFDSLRIPRALVERRCHTVIWQGRTRLLQCARSGASRRT